MTEITDMIGALRNLYLLACLRFVYKTEMKFISLVFTLFCATPLCAQTAADYLDRGQRHLQSLL